MTEKELENLGWQKMSALLDREMPVDKKRRRFLGWWWFGGVSVAITALCLMYLNGKKSDNTPQSIPEILDNKPHQDKPVVLSETLLLPKDNANTVVDLKTTENKIFLNKNAKTFKASVQAIDNQLNLNDKKTEIATNILNEHKQPDNKNINSTNNFQSTPLPIVSAQAQLPNQNTNLKTDLSQTESKTPFTIVLPLALPNAAVKLPDKPLKAINANAPDIIEPNKTNKWQWGITAGTHSNKLRKLDGYQAGIVLQKAFGNAPKWWLTTGLQYRLATPYGDSLRYTQAESLQNSSTGTSNPSFNLVNGRQLQLEKLSFLELPIQVHYALSKRWSVFSGVKAHYLINSKVQYDSTPNVVVINSSNNAKQDRFFSGSVSNKTLELNSFGAALMGGAAFKPTPAWELSLRYDFNLNNISSNPKFVFNNHFVGVNAAYFFGK